MNFKYKVLEAGKRFAPKPLRGFVRNHFSMSEFDLVRNVGDDENLFREAEDFENSPYVLGIIKEPTCGHLHYIAACRERKVSYRVLDLLSDKWVEEFRNSRCDGFLVWPASSGTMVKAAFDMRLKMLEDDLGKAVFPSWKECWLTEYKPRLRDWLQIHNVRHPKTWVFYRELEALSFVNNFRFGGASGKIVVKTATGAAGCGVWIVSTRRQAQKLVKCFFRDGVKIRAFEPWDKTSGYLFAQEYIPNVEEWRMVRIGDSYFGHRKDVGGDGKHSGSHGCSYMDPGKDFLDLLKEVTDKGDFRSMDVDVFKSPDGRMWVNECQTTFGCSVATTQMKIGGVEGRYIFDGNDWVFQQGRFCKNHCCNARVEYLINLLNSKRMCASCI